MAALSRETQESARTSLSQKAFVPAMTEEYITQVSEEIEGKSRVLGALYKLDEFLLNPQKRTCLGAVPGTSWNSGLENREPTRDSSQNGPYPEVEFSIRQTSNSADSDRKETSHNVLPCVSGTQVYHKFIEILLKRLDVITLQV